jgi:hypothetical protein
VIRRIDLEWFKCFRLLKLPLCPLTLLSGPNASGKSTVLQAMVLLHQTMLDHEWSMRLQLNGSELELGTVTDAIDKVYGRREFAIGIVDDDCSVRWTFDYTDDKQAMSAAVKTVSVNDQVFIKPERLRFLFPEPLNVTGTLAPRLRELTYLTAERVGPRDWYQLADPSATQVVAFAELRGYPFSSAVAERIRVLLDVLNRLKTGFDDDGTRTAEAKALYSNYFARQEAIFTDSSEREKNDYRAELTFPHPGRPGEYLFCTWHGKIRWTPPIRIHFSWPIAHDTPLYVVHVGPKITMR